MMVVSVMYFSLSVSYGLRFNFLFSFTTVTHFIFSSKEFEIL